MAPGSGEPAGRHGSAGSADPGGSVRLAPPVAATGPRAALLTAVALTWLNPHVYLDTVLLLGSVAATRAPYQWWFAVGAATASILWFAGLGFGARYLRPLFTRPRAWQVLDGGIAVVMLALALRIATG